MVGNTELGVEVKFKHCEYPVYINPSLVPDLTAIKIETDGVVFGAGVTLSEIEETCLQVMKNIPEENSRIFHQIVEILQWFAGED